MAIEAMDKSSRMGKTLRYSYVLGKTIGEAFTHKERSDFVDSFDRNEQHSACNVCWQDPNKFNTRVKSHTDEMMRY